MRALSLLKAVSVFTENGTKLGQVHDLAINANGTVIGLIICRPALFRSSIFVPLEDILCFGRDEVMIAEKAGRGNKFTGYTLYSHEPIAGKILLSNSGEELGLLHDVYFDEKQGTIVAYEASDGFFADISVGTKVIQTSCPPIFGKDAVVISVYDQ
ncbi:PRC-barrel domain-containing protein [Peribacillus saganii]|uniref:PRC-barrel domain-containing protein n=1 Tax=Peribacillus saganii TaxID=2303992 RepID=UPI001314BBD4|nr:PRC-barrel domain-containing protein [Peribacillus saganii]